MIARHSVPLHDAIGRRIDRDDLILGLYSHDNATRGGIVMRIARLATQRYHANPCVRPRINHEISAAALVRNENLLCGWRIRDSVRKSRTGDARDNCERAIVDDGHYMLPQTLVMHR